MVRTLPGAATAAVFVTLSLAAPASAEPLTDEQMSALAAEPESAAPPSPPPERSTPRVRGGVHVGLGGGSTRGVYSAGVGFGAELGCQFTRGFAMSVQGYGETALLAGRGHVGALVQIAPIDLFELALGGGVTALYLVNFVYDTPTAHLGTMLLRTTFRISQDGALFDTRPVQWHFTVGVEGEADLTFGGTRLEPVNSVDGAPRSASVPLEKGEWFGGGRAMVGFLL